MSRRTSARSAAKAARPRKAKPPNESAANPESRWFGFESVAPEDKTGLVRGVFDRVAARYDLMNDLMSLGLHRLWKRDLLAEIGSCDGLKVLDVAGGTGDVALGIARASSKASITVCDLNPAMIAEGKAKAIDRGLPGRVNWVTGNAETLPFDDHSFDVYTIAFGLRNVTRIDTALAEAARVLAPGGRFYCLEFSQVVLPVLDRIYERYSFSVLPWLGKMVARDEASYRYLAESIRRFPGQEALAGRMTKAGLANARFRTMAGGVVALHQGIKA